MKPKSSLWALLTTLFAVLLFPFLAFGAAGGGEGEGEGDKGDPPADPSQAFQSALQKMGGEAMALAQKLFDENFRLRTERRDLRGKLPPEGSLVLKPEDATAWQGYAELGKPEEVKAALTERDSLKQAATERDHKERVTAAASLLKWDAEVLARELAHDGLALEIEGEGDKRKALVVKDGQKTPLDAYAKEKWAKLMPALQQGADGRKPLGTPSRETQRPAAPDNTTNQQPRRPLTRF